MLSYCWTYFFEILLTSIGFFDHYLLLPFIVEGLNCMLMYHQKHIDCCKTCSSRYPFWMRSSISFRDLKILKSESQLKGQCSTWVDNSFFQMESFGVSHPNFDVSMFLMCPYFQCFNVINESMFQWFYCFNVSIISIVQCFHCSNVSMFPIFQWFQWFNVFNGIKVSHPGELRTFANDLQQAVPCDLGALSWIGLW